MKQTPTAAILLIALTFSWPSSSLTADQTQSASQVERPPTEAEQRPVFRAGANFVRVDVYPRRDGRVVEDLSAEDLRVYEDGVLQDVDTFEFIRVEPFTPDAERRDPSSMADAERQAADPRSRLFILYLDGQHMRLEGARAAARPALDFLARSMGPRDLFGVMTPDMTIQQMTLGRRLEVVETEIEDYWNEVFASRATESILDPETRQEQFLYDCYFNSGRGGERLVRRLWDLVRAERALENLRSVAARVGGIRDFRTHVLLFSGGWALPGPSPDLMQEAYADTPPIGVQNGRLTIGSREPGFAPNTAACDAELGRLAFIDFRRLFDELLDSAAENNVSFYPIDTGGLAAFDDPAREASSSRRGPPSVNRASGLQSGARRLDPLRTLASETDGLALVGTNNILEPLREIADDFSAFYLVGYYSKNREFDGKYRRIDVEIDVDDVDITARRGYLAPSEEMLAAMAAASDAAAGPAMPAGLANALAGLGRLESPAEVFVTGTARGDTVIVVAEVAENALGRSIRDGADVRVELADASGGPAGALNVVLEPGARAAMLRVPIAAGSPGPWEATISLDGGGVTERMDIERDEVAPISARLVFRARPSRVSPLWPVAHMAFRRAERVHIEWAASGPLDRRDARLLGPDGEPLAVPVTLTERVEDDQARLAADLTLTPLGVGDYVIEVTATAGGRTVQDFVGIRVTR